MDWASRIVPAPGQGGTSVGSGARTTQPGDVVVGAVVEAGRVHAGCVAGRDARGARRFPLAQERPLCQHFRTLRPDLPLIYRLRFLSNNYRLRFNYTVRQ
jgi:hypothetical protein